MSLLTAICTGASCAAIPCPDSSTRLTSAPSATLFPITYAQRRADTRPTSYEGTGLLHYPREIILSTGVPAAYPELWGSYYTPVTTRRSRRRSRVASWYTANWGWERLL